MSVLAVNKLALDLEHRAGTIDAFRDDPDAVLAGYALIAEERDEIRRLDAPALLERGVNPIVIRNLLVILGIPHARMYTHGSD